MKLCEIPSFIPSFAFISFGIHEMVNLDVDRKNKKVVALLID
jgi:hypothetical protein